MATESCTCEYRRGVTPDGRCVECGKPAEPWRPRQMIPLSPKDAMLNIEVDILGVVVRYGGEVIHAGPKMDSLIADLVGLVRSERMQQFVKLAEEVG